MSLSLSKAILFATQAHGGQRDKGGNTYIRHPLRVMEKMANEDEMIVAVLHDVVEDTTTTLDDLRNLGCTETQIMAIDALTKREGEPEEDYLIRIKRSNVAKRVKAADIRDNMDLNRLRGREKGLSDGDVARINKYLRMLSALEGV